MEENTLKNQKGTITSESTSKGQGPKQGKGEKKSGQLKDTRNIYLFGLFILILSILIIIIYSLSLGLDQFFSTLSISIMIALSSLIIGALLGFIFGIPRTPGSTRQEDIGANTNLEEISDWLIKIIVGVSLVQLTQISEGFVSLGEMISEGLGGHRSSYVFSISALTFYLVAGFLLGYLWTRIFLPKILRISYDEGLRQDLQVAESKLHEAKTDLAMEKNKQEKQLEIKQQIDILIDQSDPKNIDKYNSENFTKEKIQDLVENMSDVFDKKEASNLFAQIITALYLIRDYKLINNISDIYKDKIDIGYRTWSDIAITNMALYIPAQSEEFKIRMKEAVRNIRLKITDYGVGYAIEIYFELIDYLNKPTLKAAATENIKAKLEELKKKPDYTAFEMINYLNMNEGLPNYSFYNKTLRDDFTDEYNFILNRSNDYEKKKQEAKVTI